MDEREQDLSWQRSHRGVRNRRDRERARRGLELLARGWGRDRIAAELDMNPSACSRMLTAALEQRAEREGPRVEAARNLMLAQLDVLLAEWLPRALTQIDPMTLEAHPGNFRALEGTLKILAQKARIEGLEQPMRNATPVGDAAQTNVNVHVHSVPTEQRAELQVAVLAQLDTIRNKQRTIEGTLARDITDLGDPAEDDKPGPPPGMTRESAA